MLSATLVRRGLAHSLDRRLTTSTLADELREPLMTTTPQASSDPFYVYKDELEEKVGDIRRRLARWQDLLQSTNTATNTSFKSLNSELKNDLRLAEASLAFLVKSMQMVETNRTRFKHIDEDEFKNRADFVKRMREELQGIENETTSERVLSKLSRDDKETQDARKKHLALTHKWQQSNQSFIRKETEQQQLVIKKQDEGLDLLEQDVKKIGGMAKNIHTEIAIQNSMLEEMSTDMDEAHERMGYVMGNMSKLLKTRDRCQLNLILTLIMVLCVLVLLVLYT